MFGSLSEPSALILRNDVGNDPVTESGLTPEAGRSVYGLQEHKTHSQQFPGPGLDSFAGEDHTADMVKGLPLLGRSPGTLTPLTSGGCGHGCTGAHVHTASYTSWEASFELHLASSVWRCLHLLTLQSMTPVYCLS